MVRTPDVAHQLLNPVVSDLCLPAYLHCTPVHVHSMLLLITCSYLRSLYQMLIVL